MSTLTKEWLLKTIAELEEEHDATPGAVNEDAANALAAMKLALASLEEEGKLSSFIATQESLGGESEGVLTENIESLYVTSNPAVKITSRDLDEGFDKWYTGDACGTKSIAPEWFSEALKPVFLETWRACRAAMLQGAKPVTTAYKLPFEQWLSQQTGTIDVECGCVMTEVFFHWLRVAYEAGNSPVIPYGWVACSEQMPEENAEQEVLACFKGGDISTLYYFEGRWDDAYGIVPIRQDVTHWMPLPSAPQQEA
ncbi:DUF551 domain-containing protein [Enterobacter hormaechei]|nr:DUF551 domain-containing protein [Enterobacter hormaechei]